MGSVCKDKFKNECSSKICTCIGCNQQVCRTHMIQCFACLLMYSAEVAKTHFFPINSNLERLCTTKQYFCLNCFYEPNNHRYKCEAWKN